MGEHALTAYFNRSPRLALTQGSKFTSSTCSQATLEAFFWISCATVCPFVGSVASLVWLMGLRSAQTAVSQSCQGRSLNLHIYSLVGETFFKWYCITNLSPGKGRFLNKYKPNLDLLNKSHLYDLPTISDNILKTLLWTLCTASSTLHRKKQENLRENLECSIPNHPNTALLAFSCKECVS